MKFKEICHGVNREYSFIKTSFSLNLLERTSPILRFLWMEIQYQHYNSKQSRRYSKYLYMPQHNNTILTIFFRSGHKTSLLIEAN